jgi:hypothetical protein
MAGNDSTRLAAEEGIFVIFAIAVARNAEPF